MTTTSTTLAMAATRAQRLDDEVAGVLQSALAAGLNSGFFAQRLDALRGVHRRQLLRLQEVIASTPTVIF